MERLKEETENRKKQIAEDEERAKEELRQRKE
jgi:hypothetical protein